MNPGYAIPNEVSVRDYWNAVNDECVDDVLKKHTSTMISGFDVALIRLPEPLTIARNWEPKDMQINTLCWNTVNKFTYGHGTPLYTAGFGFKDPGDHPSLNWIRRVILTEDYYPDPTDRRFKFISDDNIGQLEESKLILSSTNRTSNGVWIQKSPGSVSVHVFRLSLIH